MAVQEPERPVARPAEAQPSRAPLQAHSSNVQAPAVAQAVQAGSKLMPPPPAPGTARPPCPPQPQVTPLASSEHNRILPAFTASAAPHDACVTVCINVMYETLLLCLFDGQHIVGSTDPHYIPLPVCSWSMHVNDTGTVMQAPVGAALASAPSMPAASVQPAAPQQLQVSAHSCYVLSA